SVPHSLVVVAADGRSARYDVKVIPRPRIVSLIAHYTYPGYTRLPRREEEIKLGEFRGVEGTQVRVEFQASMPLAEAAVVLPESRIKPRLDRDGVRGSFTFVINRDSPMNLKLTAAGGIDNLNGTPYRIRLVPDNPPTVALLNLPDSLTFYRDDVLRFSYRGADDLGISEIYVRSRGGIGVSSGNPAPSEVSIPFTPPGAREVAGEFELELRDITDENATSVAIELVMVDSKGQEAASPRLQLSIVSDSLDRLLGELAVHQDAFGQRLRTAIGALRGAGNQLNVLAEGMDDATPLEGKRGDMFDGIARTLATFQIPHVARDMGPFRVYTFTEFPDRPSRLTTMLMSDALLL
ncbi:MAG: hypothetical protein IT190_10030, partial [Microbacteriaceae bacterium]|nr:hypothetical protein [Microbacteriaceae bacterium]